MSSETKIEWTHPPGYKGETLNPVTGCKECSPGCDNCYAKTMHKRLQAMKSPKYLQDWNTVKCWPDELVKPAKTKKPTCYFINSMSDLFHKDVPDSFLHDTFNMMQANEQQRFIVLTKRSRRMKRFLTDYLGGYSLPAHIAIGVTVENNQHGVPRLDDLAGIPAWTRIVSMEPLLEYVDISTYKHFIHQVIVGGESGSNARPMHPDWVMRIKRLCLDNSIPFFFKQWGQWAPASALDIHAMKNALQEYKSFAFPDETAVFSVGKGKSNSTLNHVEYKQYPAVWEAKA